MYKIIICLLAVLGLSLGFKAWRSGAAENEGRLNKDNYDVVMFTADWCRPCQVVKKEVLPKCKNLLDKYKSFTMANIDVDNDGAVDDSLYGKLFIRLGLTSFPVIVMMDGDKLVDTIRATKTEGITVERLREWLK